MVLAFWCKLIFTFLLNNLRGMRHGVLFIGVTGFKVRSCCHHTVCLVLSKFEFISTRNSITGEFHLETIRVSVGHEEESEALVTRCSRATRKFSPTG